MKKLIYKFEEGDMEIKNFLGGKGASLAVMTKLGLPIPAGFTITTEVCNKYLENKKNFIEGLWDKIIENIRTLEEKMGKEFGGIENPLLVSVRSGAPISMPGMMDTILNLGLNDKTTEALAEKTGNKRFAYDSYRRFIQMFGDVVLEIDHKNFEEILNKIKKENNIIEDTELTTDNLKKIISEYKELIKNESGKNFPQDPLNQLEKAIKAVFNSWDNFRAIKYREINNIDSKIGTAVNIQSMVFGNMGNTSGTGVAFTRNPSTGEKELFGEFLMNAQGEDVVAGIRNPESIFKLKEKFPELFNEFNNICTKLELHFKDMQDIEFTIEKNKLYFLQTRTGKRSAKSGLKIAVDMVEEGIIDEKEAILRIDIKTIDHLLHPTIDPNAKRNILTKGLPASPGVACGKICFTVDVAEKLAASGEDVILVRYETSPEDISGMYVSRGILTACGGMTSHAAVIARGIGTPCVSGASKITINEKEKKLNIGDKTISEGEEITIDGNNGEVMSGLYKMIQPEISGDFEKVLSWTDKYRSIKVLTNSDTPVDSKRAINFGAEGIGLCRTEHMFFTDERIKLMRKMILSSDKKQREKILSELLIFQKEDFKGIFEEMDNFPVTVRLLDPPLHEFLPSKDSEIKEIAEEMGIEKKDLKNKIKYLSEINPMLGHRGVRLMLSHPEIARMQTKAIIEASCELKKKGKNPRPEIMIPLVGLEKELSITRKIVEEEIGRVLIENNLNLDIPIGTMIELPRACIVANEIAKHADFFSFGTNDLTQMTFGYSRDDIGKFLPEYLENKYINFDPFQTLDKKGVGELVKMGVKKGKSVKDLKIGVCGEHGGDPESIDFFIKSGLDYVSCSPFRVPIARIAAAQSCIRKDM